jgi:hypothetical protein
MSMDTFDELSDEDLYRIEARVRAASAGPWVSYVAGRNEDTDVTCIELGTCNELGTMNCLEVNGGSIADQDFIASARQDLPRLLREVRVLRARLDALSNRGTPLDAAPRRQRVALQS